MEKNFRLTIEYDGTSYHGWQMQKDLRTVQGEITNALGTIMQQKVPVIGSGRTDAGVHALGQVASFRCNTRLLPGDIMNALNSLLPDDIVIIDCAAVSPDFHAQYSAKSKTYLYRILNRKIPAAVFRHYAWHVKPPLDLDAMDRAASLLVGRHDFSSFEGAGSPKLSSERTVTEAFFKKETGGYIGFHVTADGFLKHMVRNIVGTLVEVGLGKIEPSRITEILGAKERSMAGATAPAHGLFLVSVTY